VVQDLTHGSGRFNVGLGALTTMWGVGAALSNIVAGWIVVAAGYDAAFISLGIVAAAGLALYATAMPETGPNAPRNGGLTQASGLPRTGETRG
jgi:MFS family permease